ncbi:hypothetical protein BH11ARM1_BH11ARM1_15420 [soil metagenome]
MRPFMTVEAFVAEIVSDGFKNRDVVDLLSSQQLVFSPMGVSSELDPREGFLTELEPNWAEPLIGRSVCWERVNHDDDADVEHPFDFKVGDLTYTSSFPFRNGEEVFAFSWIDIFRRDPIYLIMDLNWGYRYDYRQFDVGLIAGVLIRAYDYEGFLIAWL